MTPQALPNTIDAFMSWTWAQIEPHFEALIARELTDANAVDYLNDVAKLASMIIETSTRLNVISQQDTTDQAATERYLTYSESVLAPTQAALQAIRQKVLASGVNPPLYATELRNMRVTTELFRDENLPLFVEQDRLGTKYDEIIGGQTVEWNGEETTLPALQPVYQDPDRATREKAWRLANERRLADKAALNDLWVEFLKLRSTIAANADMPDVRAFVWRAMLRFDYSPADCEAFADGIEKTFVPAAARIYERRKQRLGVDKLRPWDLDVDPLNCAPLSPFDAKDIDKLMTAASAMFHQVDPVLGGYFDQMRAENLLDLDNRKGKAPGGFCTTYEYTKRPFIFMNAVGIHDDVNTLLHEGGHAFHAFESFSLPEYARNDYPTEFAEVASMSMELLAAPYLTTDHGGFYSAEDAARARIEHLEGIVLFLPYMAVVDSFQHWVYTHPDQAIDPANCDAKWSELWDRFMIGIDYSGLEDAKADGWHRKLHIFQIPFYYVEYGLAQLGALQVWRNSLSDQAGAVAAYRRALALGGTVTLPELFSAAGAKFAWDVETLTTAVNLIESTLQTLDP